MRKIVLIILILLPTIFFGQSVLDRFDGQEDITSIIVNKKMFELMSKMAVDSEKESQQYQGLIKKLENLKVYSTTNKRATSQMKDAYGKYLKSGGLEELIRVNDNGGNLKIAVKSVSGDSKIKELLMFMEGSSDLNPTVLMSLTGSFDLNEISTLTDKMKIPRSEEFKNAMK
jgi:hypothetical protein